VVTDKGRTVYPAISTLPVAAMATMIATSRTFLSLQLVSLIMSCLPRSFA
jgi:hypothetical protein